MKRNFASVYSENEQDGYSPGDQAAAIAAGALAQKLDAPTIGRILDMFTLLETVGGQFYVTPLRVQDPNDPGAYRTEAIVFNYETRDIKVQKYEPPSEILGLPVTDSHEPGVEIEPPTEIPVANEIEEAQEQAEEAEEERDLRDEIEAEVDAELQEA